MRRRFVLFLYVYLAPPACLILGVAAVRFHFPGWVVGLMFSAMWFASLLVANCVQKGLR